MLHLDRILVGCIAAGTLVLTGCAGVELDPFGRPYSGEYNFPAGRTVCKARSVDVQPYFVRGNLPPIPITNYFTARNAKAIVTYRIDANGAVHILKSDSADKAFADHAAIAVKDWKFKPAMRGGAAVAVECKFEFFGVFSGYEDEPPGQDNA